MGSIANRSPADPTKLGRLRGFHSLNAVMTVALIVTGLLITYPDLRAQLIGGYAMRLSEWHRWTGVAFIAIPLLWLCIAPTTVLRNIGWHLSAPRLDLWRKAHYAASLLASVVLVVTGILLWVDDVRITRATFELAITAHVASTWVVILMIPLHLLSTLHKVVRAKRRQEIAAEPRRAV